MATLEYIKGIFLNFGAAWVLWFLGALSLASLALIIERAVFYRSLDGNLRGLADEIDGRLSKGEAASAMAALEGARSVAASVAAAGLRLAHLGHRSAEKAMQSASALERARLERGLAFLGTLGNNAPFIGLFGTVIGVIEAFEHLGQGHGPGTPMASDVASRAVMTSVAEALVATAVGILVALPAVAANNFFQRRVSALLSSSDVLSSLVLAYLVAKPSPGEEPDGRRAA